VKYLDKCIPGEKPSQASLEKKAHRVQLILEKHTTMLTYEQWIDEEKVRRSTDREQINNVNTSTPTADSPPPAASSADPPPDLEIGRPPILVPESPVNTVPGDSESIPGSTVWTTDCAVCLSEFAPAEQVRELECTHIFHSECIQDWFMKARSPACPLCRNVLHSGISEEDIIRPVVLVPSSPPAQAIASA
jgi:hypothetical protein